MTEQTTTETIERDVPVAEAREGDLLILRTGETTVQGRLRKSIGLTTETLEIPHAGWNIANLANVGQGWESVRVVRTVPLPVLPTEPGTTFVATVRGEADVLLLVGRNGHGENLYTSGVPAGVVGGVRWDHAPEHIDRASIRNVITLEQHLGDLDAPRPAMRAALEAIAGRLREIDSIAHQSSVSEQLLAVIDDLRALAGDA